MHTDVNETDLVVDMLKEHADQRIAEQRAKFDMAVQVAAAKYKQRCKTMRKVYHWLNQLSMILVGVAGVVVAVLAATESSWRTIVAVLALALLLSFSQWCHRKSRRVRHE